MKCNIMNNQLRISPIGYFKGIDGREYYVNANTVVSNTKHTKMIPIDYYHQSETDNNWIEAGYINTSTLLVKEDGIYANIVFVKDFDTSNLHSFSPTYEVYQSSDNVKEVYSITSVALVSEPNLPELKVRQQNSYKELNFMADTNRELNELTSKYAELNTQHKELNNKHEDIKTKYTELNNKHNDLVKDYEKVIKELNQLKNDLRIKEFNEIIKINPNVEPFKEFALEMNDEHFKAFKDKAIKNYQDTELIKTENKVTKSTSEVFKQLGLEE